MLARVLHQKVNENLNKQRIKAGNDKSRGESASQMGQLERAFKRELDSMENQKACLGGAKLEAQLGKTIDIMKEVEKVEKIYKRMKAKLAALIEQEKGWQKSAFVDEYFWKRSLNHAPPHIL